MPYDQIKKQQKEFAYVDFQTEADAQEALKNHEEVRSVSSSGYYVGVPCY